MSMIVSTRNLLPEGHCGLASELISMKNARQLCPEGEYQRRLQQFDLREIDAADPHSVFHLKYLNRLRRVRGAIRRHCRPGARVLEIGCSQANASLLLAEAGYLTVALDLRIEALQYARSKYERGSFYPLVGSAEALPGAANSLDAVILGELLEHCAQPPAIVCQACFALKPGGILVITTPNGNYLGSKQPLYAPDLLSAEELQARQFGPAGEDHLFAFSREGLKNLLAGCGLQVLRCGYIGSVVYSDKLRVVKKLLPVRWLAVFSSMINKLPWLNRLLSYTLVVICRKK